MAWSLKQLRQSSAFRGLSTAEQSSIEYLWSSKGISSEPTLNDLRLFLRRTLEARAQGTEAPEPVDDSSRRELLEKVRANIADCQKRVSQIESQLQRRYGGRSENKQA